MGNINKKLFSKLIEKVGFEALLYDTLVSLCNEVEEGLEGVENQWGAISGGKEGMFCALEEAKEILEAYGEHLKNAEEARISMRQIGFTKEIKSQVTVPLDHSSPIVQGAGPVKQEALTAKNEAEQVWKDVELPALFPKRDSEKEEVSRVTVQLPLQGPKPSPKLLRSTIQVGETLGQSQGTLPVPGDHQIVNRDRISILTKNNLILGGAKSDGQVKESNHVSGLIQSNGKYALVFKDTTLGSAVIRYEILQEREPKELEFEMISLPDGDSGGWVSFVRDPEVLVEASTMEEAKRELVSTLERDYGMKVISVTTTKATKEQEEAMKQRKMRENLL